MEETSSCLRFDIHFLCTYMRGGWRKGRALISKAPIVFGAHNIHLLQPIFDKWLCVGRIQGKHSRRGREIYTLLIEVQERVSSHGMGAQQFPRGLQRQKLMFLLPWSLR